ncbi:hypothetical protein, partial [Nonomuraea sp. NPDC002799]
MADRAIAATTGTGVPAKRAGAADTALAGETLVIAVRSVPRTGRAPTVRETEDLGGTTAIGAETIAVVRRVRAESVVRSASAMTEVVLVRVHLVTVVLVVRV